MKCDFSRLATSNKRQELIDFSSSSKVPLAAGDFGRQEFSGSACTQTAAAVVLFLVRQRTGGRTDSRFKSGGRIFIDGADRALVFFFFFSFGLICLWPRRELDSEKRKICSLRRAARMSEPLS